MSHSYSRDIIKIALDIMDDVQLTEFNIRLQELEKDFEKEYEIEQPETTTTKVTNERPPQGKSQVRAGVNTWSDEGEERDDIDDKIVRVAVKRKPRPASSKVERTCSVCNRTVKVPQVLASTHYYRCERCTGR